jgi:hypothetical protein
MGNFAISLSVSKFGNDKVPFAGFRVLPGSQSDEQVIAKADNTFKSS